MTMLLYVDDEETIGRAVAKWFGGRGHTVHLARSVAEARKVLTTEATPDAVFIDVWLGDESGFDLMSWIEDVRPELADRVTFVTGELADKERAGQTWRTLGRPVLQKPFEFSQLEALAGATERRHGT